MKAYFILLFVTVRLCLQNVNASEQYSIQYIDTNNGLSQNEVTSILQDQHGFMWFGTRGGLNRYDGYNFKHYKPDGNKYNSLVNPSVERLYADEKGNIWIGTKSGGFCCYDISQEAFYTPKVNEQTPNRIVTFLSEASSLWIGGWTGGLWEYVHPEDSIRHLLGNARVNTLAQTPDGTIWCGTNDGLRYGKTGQEFQTHRINLGYQEITELLIDSNDEPYLWIVGWDMHLIRFNYKELTYEQYKLPWEKDNLSPKAYSLLQDKKGDIWVGTWGDGLYKFNTKDCTFQQIDIKPKNVVGTSIDYDVILDIYEDREGDIWIGTDGGGIVRLSEQTRFKTIGSQIARYDYEHHVNAVLVDKQQRTWIGTKGSGVYLLDKGNRVRKLDFLPADQLYQKQGLVAKRIYQDHNETIWISFNEGLYVVNETSNGNLVLVNSALVFKSPQLRQIKKAHDILLKGNDLWVATQQNGLYYYRNEAGFYQLVRQFMASAEAGKLPVNRITSLLMDSNSRLWVGTYKGLFQYQSADSTFTPVQQLITNDRSPLCDIILTAYIDNNNLWFGTPCSLNKLAICEDEQYELTDYTSANGLTDDYINGVLVDENEHVWVSTNAGISMLDTKAQMFRNYDVSDGIGGSNFSESACFRADDGTLYFGGFSDLTFFHPNDIQENTTTPPVVVTSFKILNQEVPVKEDGLLSASINETKKLVLTHRESEFSFEIASLDFKAPQRNQYGYWLEGSGEQRVNIGIRRHISFSNLKPGDYTLHLMGTNSNGVWSQNVRTVDIEVLPAPWRSWYAVIIYVAIVLLVVAFITMITRKQERLVNAAEMEKVLREQEHQMNEYKFRFFTNISHEIRTPLTLILAPVNELLRKDMSALSPAFIARKMQVVHQHTSRLYSLVNQLLEFRKMEAGKVKLQASEQDVVRFISEICKGFDELAATKKITFKKKFQAKTKLIFFDNERLGVVISNLLSNAFKFVGEPGWVTVELNDASDNIFIKITNNGKGFPADELELLFERFYQASGKHSLGSSGIGLALVKSYVELHHGTISVESQPGESTTFTISLPTGQKHLSADEIRQVESGIGSVIATVEPESLPRTKSINKGAKGAKVLLVEDNQEVRNYMADLLSDDFEVLEASDGIDGYDMLIEHQPQIVISDVMMPRMDGFELCQNIKSNDLVAHIPVVLLTAKGTPQDQLFGTRKGADAYLTKPFDPELLIEKVKQLIASRKLLSDKYAQKVRLEPTDAEIKSAEGKLLEQAIKVIEKHMGDTSFDPEKLASELAMSTSTFYRKIKKLTQQPPGEFIKSIRLKRAAQLLKETDLTVSEIIEHVGYQDIKNFRKNFKHVYDLTPSDYRKQHGDL